MTANGFQWHTLKVRVTLFMLAIFLASIAVITFHVSQELQQDVQLLLGGQQRSTVSLVAANINRELSHRLDSLSRMAAALSPAVPGRPAALQQALQEYSGLHDLFNGGIFITGLDGTVMAAVPLLQDRLGVNYLDQECVADAIRRGQTTIGRPIMGLTVAMATPLRNAQGQVIGALAGVTDLSLPNFLDIITQNRHGQTGGYVLAAGQHRLMVTATDQRRMLQPMPAPGINAMTDRRIQGDDTTIVSIDHLGTEVLTSAARVPAAGWFLVAVLPTAEAFAPISNLQRRIFLAALVLAALVTGLTIWLLRHLLAPLSAAAKALAKPVSAGQPWQPLPVVHPDEIGLVLTRLNAVVEALQAQKEVLRQNDVFIRSIMDSVDAEIAVLDPAGVIVLVNEPWRRFAQENGLQPDQPAPHTGIGSNYLAVCRASLGDTPADAGALAAAEGIEAVLAGRVPRFSMEYPCDAPDQARWFQLIVTPLGQPVQGVVVSHADITGRVLSQQAMVESEERFHQFMKHLPAAAFIKDQAGSVLFANRYMEDNLGLPAWQGKSTAELFAPLIAQQMMADDRRALQTGWLVTEEQVPQASGELRSYRTHKFKISRAGQPPLLGGIGIDITEYKQMTDALLAAKLAAEKANHAKSKFLAAASHDLRQPLAALGLYVGVLQHKVEADNQILIERIQQCCASLNELLTNLLDVSRLEARVITPKLSVFAVDEFMAAVHTVHSAEAALKGLRLRWRPCRASVHTDRQLLLRIVGNLVSNAVRYTQQGGVLLACRRHGGKHWLEVWDTGIGIAADQTELVFEEFVQLGLESAQHGSGLGLAIVARAAALLGLQLR
ncbi:MAG: PAS domain-containing protein, partial [Rhodoferax sp.]